DQCSQKQKYAADVARPESHHTSPSKSSSSDTDSDDLPTFPLENLIGYDFQSHMNEFIMPQISELIQWERREKVLISEIVSRYDNHWQRESLFSTVKNQPAKMDALFIRAKSGTVTYNNTYNDNILDKVLNRLENISVEAQAYFNKWSKDKDMVVIANTKRDRAV
ncbi:hypothetical protein KI387_010700, partial [Taxus chinensis]